MTDFGDIVWNDFAKSQVDKLCFALDINEVLSTRIVNKLIQMNFEKFVGKNINIKIGMKVIICENVINDLVEAGVYNILRRGALEEDFDIKLYIGNAKNLYKLTPYSNNVIVESTVEKGSRGKIKIKEHCNTCRCETICEYESVQDRSPDEPETGKYNCTICGHHWST